MECLAHSLMIRLGIRFLVDQENCVCVHIYHTVIVIVVQCALEKPKLMGFPVVISYACYVRH